MFPEGFIIPAFILAMANDAQNEFAYERQRVRLLFIFLMFEMAFKVFA